MKPKAPLTEGPNENKPGLLEGEEQEERAIIFGEPVKLGSVTMDAQNVKHCGATETELNSLLSSGDQFSICLSATMMFLGVLISTIVQWLNRVSNNIGAKITQSWH